MNKKRMIAKLNDMFPGIGATDATVFHGTPNDGIWFKYTESAEIDGLMLYNDTGYEDTFGVHPQLYVVLEMNGWFAEPYDPGTLMAYPE